MPTNDYQAIDDNMLMLLN